MWQECLPSLDRDEKVIPERPEQVLRGAGERCRYTVSGLAGDSPRDDKRRTDFARRLHET